MVEMCLHAANVLYLLSFLGRDMLWLRLLTCGGLALGVVFFSCQPRPLYGPTGWHVAFLLINGYQIWRLLQERKRLRLSKKQERVGGATFDHLSREELLTLLTRVMSKSPESADRPLDVDAAAQEPLTRQEVVLRDIAFSRLSRGELLNLLTRKMWGTIVRLNPSRWRRGRRPKAEGPGREAA